VIGGYLFAVEAVVVAPQSIFAVPQFVAVLVPFENHMLGLVGPFHIEHVFWLSLLQALQTPISLSYTLQEITAN
jgi:hypothetical protein